jgi:hypothetical protein
MAALIGLGAAALGTTILAVAVDKNRHFTDVTITVTDAKTGTVLPDVTVTINGVKYTTNATGQIVVKILYGVYAFAAALAGYITKSGSLTCNAPSLTLPIALAATASITLSPTSGTDGMSVTVSGTNFTASTGITVSFAGNAVASATSSSAGSFSATFSIPASQPNGSYPVSASDATHSASATFTVTGGVKATKWIEIKAVQNNIWCLKAVSGVSNGYTPSTLLTLLGQIYDAIGPYNIQKFVRTECPPGYGSGTLVSPTAVISGGDGSTTTGELCTKAAAACHGLIVNNLDMDSYPGVSDDCCSGTPGPNYPCAQTPANFFATNAKALNACYPSAMCFLEAWCPGAFDHVVNQDWVGQPMY